MREITITLDDWEEEIVDFIKNGYNASQDKEVVEDEDVIHGIIASFVEFKAAQVEGSIIEQTLEGSGLVQ